MSISRRQFVTSTSFLSGFALAVHPIVSSVIKTSDENLTTGFVKIPSNQGEFSAYRAMPNQGNKFPLVLVIHEIFGVHEHIQDVCRRFAKLGYAALAPNLFERQGDVTKLKTIDEIRKVVSEVPDSQVMSDIDSTIDWSIMNAKTNKEWTGITGFCWGGRITWLYAAHNPRIKAGVAWYGRLVGTKSALTPIHPIDLGEKLTVPILGLYGGQDQGIPLDTVEAMRKELGKGKSNSEIVVYSEAPHAFFADYRPSYRSSEAEDGWKRLQLWFKDNNTFVK